MIATAIEVVNPQRGVRCQFEALGTLNTITVYGRADDALLDCAVNRVLEIDSKMSAFKASSDISRLNRSAGRESVKLSPETISLLCLAKTFGTLSGGAFDVTVRPLAELWGIGKKHNFIPTRNERDEAAKLVCDQDLVINREDSTAYLKRPKQAVDLGGIAKGYAADEVKRILIEGGVASALVNLGGNIVAIGTHPDGKPWRIGVQNPAAATGEYLGVLSVADKTVVTPGSNEQFFMKDGVRHHHILDPRTGAPARSGLLSVTAICDRSARADALTTAVFVLGMEQGMKLLQKCNTGAVFVMEDLQVFATEGLLTDFSMSNTKKQQSLGGNHEDRQI